MNSLTTLKSKVNMMYVVPADKPIIGLALLYPESKD